MCTEAELGWGRSGTDSQLSTHIHTPPQGLEHVLLPHLIVTGALCQATVDLVLYEGHLWNEWSSRNGTTDEAFVDFFNEFVAEQGGCRTEIRLFDDESYDTTQRPLPK